MSSWAWAVLRVWIQGSLGKKVEQRDLVLGMARGEMGEGY